MADDGLLIPIQFTLEEARAALNQLEAQARASGQRVGEGVGGGVSKGLAGLKAQMGPARESAMFFTQALGEFGPQGRTAQIALSGLAGAIMGGGGVLAALALAQTAARLMSSAFSENEEAARKAAQGYETLIGRVDEYARKVEGSAVAAGAQGRARELEQLAQEQAAEQERLGKEYNDLVDALEAARAARSKARDVETIKSTREKVFFLEGEELRLRDSLSKIDETYLVRRREVNKKYDDELLGQVKKVNDERQALNAQAHAAAWQLEVDYAARKTALLGEAEKIGLDQRQLVELEYQRTMATLREGDDASAAAALAIRNAKLKAIDQAAYEERAALVAEFRAEIQAGELELLTSQMAVQAEFGRFMQTSWQQLASSALGAFRPILTQSAAYNRAMKEAGGATKASADLSAAAFAAMTQDFLANLALQAASKAIFEIAEGYVALANPATAALAPMHFTAATNYGIVAGVAAAGAVAIGATRGMTAAEKASVADASGQGIGGASVGGAREFGGGAGAGGTVTVRETIYVGVVANDFESPAETARRAARVMELVDRLDLQRREA